ncbi:hypothetical protein [Pedobacter endophyticus]|uniref:SnoaL-like domain-containing protein n=1 Tax=Pedobacter endophyticus TaxID=2789740 RepID=A0A7S9L1A7_9SPHI|nr:hypothetical protein [Pedobacter endophyticus]QPH40588.1 hypothetical protein IZT61_04725 [Pedobacter endophyticus]
MKNKITCLFLLTVIILSCKQTKTYINRPEDKAKALELTKKFYQFLKNRDQEGALLLFNLIPNQPQYQAKRVALLETFQNILNRYGDLKSIELVSNSSAVVEAEALHGSYKIEFRSQRDKYQRPLRERFILKSDNEAIKIMGFKVDSLIK